MLIRIDGIPLAKARVRAGIRGKHAHVYDPQKPKLDALACEIKRLLPSDFQPVAGPIAVKLRYGMPYPKSLSKKKRLNAYPTRVDLDNLVKATQDAGNKILWDDDRHIVSLEATKFYSDEPHTLIMWKQEPVIED